MLHTLNYEFVLMVVNVFVEMLIVFVNIISGHKNRIVHHEMENIHAKVLVLRQTTHLDQDVFFFVLFFRRFDRFAIRQQLWEIV